MDVTLTAETGRPLGSRSSRRLLRDGKVPGVVYGLDQDTVAVAVEWPDLRAALTTDAGLNALITLEVDGDEDLTIVKDLQRDPVRRDVVHVDFLRVSRDVEIEVEVPDRPRGPRRAGRARGRHGRPPPVQPLRVRQAGRPSPTSSPSTCRTWSCTTRSGSPTSPCPPVCAPRWTRTRSSSARRSAARPSRWPRRRSSSRPSTSSPRPQPKRGWRRRGRRWRRRLRRRRLLRGLAGAPPRRTRRAPRHSRRPAGRRPGQPRPRLRGHPAQRRRRGRPPAGGAPRRPPEGPAGRPRDRRRGERRPAAAWPWPCPRPT